jgi:hypothetical protein
MVVSYRRTLGLWTVTMGYCPQPAILNHALTLNQQLRYLRAVYNR